MTLSKFLKSGVGFDYNGKVLSIYRIYEDDTSAAKETVDLTRTQMISLGRFIYRCLVKRKI